MIGIVVVSHSPALAQAAVDLALEMVRGDRPAIAVAAGAGEGVTGTDATAVADAVDEVAGPDGVLVMMDLGSAVMSAEMALELRSSEVPVTLSSAPFVEGLISAIVTAAGGASLDEVDREATGALAQKQSMLGGSATENPVEAPPAAEEGEHLTIINPDGLHARPAASLVSALAGFDAKVTIANATTAAKPVAGNSLIGLLSLGVKTGDVVTVAASGPQAAEALEKVRELVASGFGEMGETTS
ncbi:MAG: ptsP [Microbacteriaceae bacterium]|nr:ptsP [Microbacteriaceae bacterium]